MTENKSEYGYCPVCDTDTPSVFKQDAGIVCKICAIKDEPVINWDNVNPHIKEIND